MADELVTLATFFDPTTAALAKGELEAAGIRAQLSGNAAASLFGGGIEPMKLSVLQSDFDRALEILGEPEPLSEGEDIPASEDFQSADRMHGFEGTSVDSQEEAASTAVTSTVPEVVANNTSVQETPHAEVSAPLPEPITSDQTDLAVRFLAPEVRFFQRLSSWVFVILFGLAVVAVVALAKFR